MNEKSRRIILTSCVWLLIAPSLFSQELKADLTLSFNSRHIAFSEVHVRTARTGTEVEFPIRNISSKTISALFVGFEVRSPENQFLFAGNTATITSDPQAYPGTVHGYTLPAGFTTAHTTVPPLQRYGTQVLFGFADGIARMTSVVVRIRRVFVVFVDGSTSYEEDKAWYSPPIPRVKEIVVEYPMHCSPVTFAVRIAIEGTASPTKEITCPEADRLIRNIEFLPALEYGKPIATEITVVLANDDARAEFNPPLNGQAYVPIRVLRPGACDMGANVNWGFKPLLVSPLRQKLECTPISTPRAAQR